MSDDVSTPLKLLAYVPSSRLNSLLIFTCGAVGGVLFEKYRSQLFAPLLPNSSSVDTGMSDEKDK